MFFEAVFYRVLDYYYYYAVDLKLFLMLQLKLKFTEDSVKENKIGRSMEKDANFWTT
jgi:hypothetical protein